MSSNNMTAIKDVVFDFGGVLLDWQPRRALEGAAAIDDFVLDDFFSEDDRCGFNCFEDLRDRGATKEETLT